MRASLVPARPDIWSVRKSFQGRRFGGRKKLGGCVSVCCCIGVLVRPVHQMHAGLMVWVDETRRRIHAVAACKCINISLMNIHEDKIIIV